MTSNVIKGNIKNKILLLHTLLIHSIVKVYYTLRGSKSTRLTSFTIPNTEKTIDHSTIPIPLKTCLWSICSSRYLISNCITRDALTDLSYLVRT
jgi:hypothetical protein